MNNPFFSVIIPTFNRFEVLQRAIESVKKQTFKNFELIIVDDGSTDSTQEVLKNIDDIKHFKIPNSGVSKARNFGVENSKGKWLAFLDSDDEWLENKLEKQYEFISRHPQCPIVHGEEIWIRNNVRVNQKKIHQKFGGFIYQKCLPLCLISPSAVCIEKNVFLQNGSFDESFEVCEDYDLWLKLTSLYEVGFIADPIIKKYGGHEDQLSRKYFAMDLWRIRSLINILKIRELKGDDLDLTLKEIKKKSDILIKGYNKHENIEKVAQVKQMIQHLNI